MLRRPIFVLGFSPIRHHGWWSRRCRRTRVSLPATKLPLINDHHRPDAAHAEPVRWGIRTRLAELWMGDQRDGLDNLRDYYLQKVAQMGRS